ncbi:MAG: 3-deoxy-D-manno-octulosonic acid transferase [Sphaerospermopsis sp. SIO1G2]|nr:3-deoxy-D-manno-octulosonic acid transferase [Sphaerospermopsis sp. SIO1G2]
MYYSLYRALSYLLALCLPLHLRWRAYKGKEERLRLAERMGHASVPRPSTPLIWVHAASMGESQSVLPLIKQWIRSYPEMRLLLTTVTVTSAKYVATKLPPHAFHQYAPLDTPQAVRRFLDHWQPDMVCFVDSELWPNLLMETHARDIPMILLNGRISVRSAARWHYVRPLCEALLTRFTHIFAKSDEDARRFTNLGAKHVKNIGNMKFSSPPLTYDSKQMHHLSALIGNRPVWLAASTHPDEERMIGEIHAELRQTFDELLTIIVPRHSQRGDEIRRMLEMQALSVAQRSRMEQLHDTTDIYVADTMGELGIFYRLASIACIGGSLVPHGGQNPFEAAHLDCAIVYGPHMDNFLEFCQELERASAALPVRDAAHLHDTIDALLRDHTQQEKMAAAAQHVVSQNQDVITRLDEALTPLLQQITQERH